MEFVAFVPAHFPERFSWLADSLPTLAERVDRVVVVASYAAPGPVPDGVEWHHVPEATPTGRKYRYAVGLAHAGDVIGIMDDDDTWLPEKAEAVRRAFDYPRVGLFAHAAHVSRDGRYVMELPSSTPNGSMMVFRRDMMMSPRVLPYFDRLEWGADSFLRYAPLAASWDVVETEVPLAVVRYHEDNSSHVRATGYREFDRWQRTIALRYLRAWNLIDEMTTGLREGWGTEGEGEVERKVAEFDRLYRMGAPRSLLHYLAAKVRR